MDNYRGIPLELIADNEPLKPGDRIVVRFKWLGQSLWSRAFHWYIAEKKLESRPDFRVISYNTEGDYLTVEIEIKPPDPEAKLTQASLNVLAIAAIIIALVYGLVRTEQWIERRSGLAPVSPIAQAATGFKWFGLAAIVGTVYLLFRTMKGR